MHYHIFIGTPTYMSPEIFDGDIGYGARPDIWSLAAVIFEFANGPYPREYPNRPMFEDIYEVMDWYTNPNKTDLITHSNIGAFSQNFKSFFRNMLSTERHRPRSLSVLEKSPNVGLDRYQLLLSATTFLTPNPASYMG